jgi:hypothetical protein
VPAIVAVAPGALAAWWLGALVEPHARILTALLVVVLAAGVLGAYVVGLRWVGGGAHAVSLRPRSPAEGSNPPVSAGDAADPVPDP